LLPSQLNWPRGLLQYGWLCSSTCGFYVSNFRLRHFGDPSSACSKLVFVPHWQYLCSAWNPGTQVPPQAHRSCTSPRTNDAVDPLELCATGSASVSERHFFLGMCGSYHLEQVHRWTTWWKVEWRTCCAPQRLEDGEGVMLLVNVDPPASCIQLFCVAATLFLSHGIVLVLPTCLHRTAGYSSVMPRCCSCQRVKPSYLFSGRLWQFEQWKPSPGVTSGCASVTESESSHGVNNGAVHCAQCPLIGWNNHTICATATLCAPSDGLVAVSQPQLCGAVLEQFRHGACQVRGCKAALTKQQLCDFVYSCVHLPRRYPNIASNGTWLWMTVSRVMGTSTFQVKDRRVRTQTTSYCTAHAWRNDSRLATPPPSQGTSLCLSKTSHDGVGPGSACPPLGWCVW
jgi:hypothetical protein